MDKQAIAAEIPHLLRYARALVRDPVLAQDLVQDSLERALGRWHLFVPRGRSLRSWLFTILHNVHNNSVRDSKRKLDQRTPEVFEEDRHGVSPGTENPLLLRELKCGLDQLADDQRAVVLLVGLEGMSYREASRILGVPVGTIMSRLARGRKHLRHLMDFSEQQVLRRVK